MSKTPAYSVLVGPAVLSKAKRVLGSLLLLTIILMTAATHHGVVSGDFDRTFVEPVRNFQVGLAEGFQTWLEVDPAAPTPMVGLYDVSPTAEPAVEPTNVPVQQKPVQQAAPANCIRLNIREGEFTSNKCYSQGDYDDLRYYLQRYNSAVFSYDAAVASMRITCSGSDFFKQSCEEDTKQKADAEIDINNYRTTVHSIIGKGR